MFSSEQNCLGLVSLDYRESKDSVLQTCWMVFALTYEIGIIFDGRMDGHTDRR